MAADLLLEMGTEELPASFIAGAARDLGQKLLAALDAAGLSHGPVETFGTPRRLGVRLRDVADRTADRVEDCLGPPVTVAFDARGEPTKAALRFAEGLGLSVSGLDRRTTAKGEYLAARVTRPGVAAGEILAPALHAAVHGIAFRKAMRWGDVEQSFARPVRWIVALHGAEVVPLVFGDVRSGRATRGHRFLHPGDVELKTSADHARALADRHVLPSAEARRRRIEEETSAIAASVGATVVSDPSLLDEVANLVEWPVAVTGSFDPRHLDLPREVLIQEMRSHQRYFALSGKDGGLLPRFIAVSGTPVRDPAVSVRGYERVLRARLADARYFFDEDRRTPLADRVPMLDRIVFQAELGSVGAKATRVRSLALEIATLADRAGITAVLDRAAFLCKADLVTGMVGEFPELQGVMGREYALASGEPPEVAKAIFEHWAPRGADDALPSGDAGAILGIADRIDTLAGLFGIGRPPSGDKDPFGLRRACLGVIHILRDRNLRVALPQVIDLALARLAPVLASAKGGRDAASVREALLEFFRGRLRALFAETRRADVVEAVLAAGFDDIAETERRLVAVAALAGHPDMEPVAAVFRRAVNIVVKQAKDVAAGLPDVALLREEGERRLYAAWESAREAVESHAARGDYAAALKAAVDVRPALDAFFDSVLVMADDPALRANRIRLLSAIGALPGRIADVSRIHAGGE